jgi:nucleoside phosphorylase
MKLFLFATLAEAEATVHKFKAQPVPHHFIHTWKDGSTPSLYSLDQGFLAISGIGVLAAQHTVSQIASKQNILEVWNLGFAGSLMDHYVHGSLFSIGTVDLYTQIPSQIDLQSQECFQSSLPSIPLQSEGKLLISSHFPVHSNKIRNTLSKKWNLVDMEAYGVAYACSRLKISCKIWKIISDFATQKGRNMIDNTKHELSESLAGFIFERTQDKIANSL